uniref:photosystem II protein Z n=1 Tax=Madagascaria erythrocladioides TaxID=753684 RepID=UPI001BEED9EE|nr:photosystem II protein Z [Madagascaria erythrocladioides]QUE29086.1 PsbZ [Madagascaria erythrocladioides]UNJ16641.1 photosystem II protein Z [Madagascaria erythrocladioides]
MLINIALQLLVLTIVVISTFLTITIPVVLASPGQWEQSKNLIYTGAGLWAGLIIFTGIINSFAT